MTAFSNYLESGILQHFFLGSDFPKPDHIAVALCSGVDESSILEIASGDGTNISGYTRMSLGDPAVSGNDQWSYSQDDFNAGSGVIKNENVILFPTALQDWGAVSGVAIMDSPVYGEGNILMIQSVGPRDVFEGETIQFDQYDLEIQVD